MTSSWLTTTEAGKAMGISATTVWRMANRQQIPSNAMIRSGAKGGRVRVARWWVEGRQQT